MELKKARSQASQVATLLTKLGTHYYAQELVKRGLGTSEGAQHHVHDPSYRFPDTRFHEILIYGSVAREESNPKDLDIMALDSGFHSHSLITLYGMERLKRILHLLLDHWSFLTSEQERKSVQGTPTDLVTLPLRIFTDAEARQDIVQRQSDPFFFQNAFSRMLRYDHEMSTFVPVDIAYFEEKYKTDLAWLRKPECPHCKGTGIIETGNDDLPCHCPKGDTAMFNVAGIEGLVSGSDLKTKRI